MSDRDEKFVCLGDRLKAERKRMDMSQAALANAVGTTPRTVIQWEKGVTSPSGDILATCSQLGMDLLYVLTGQRTPTPAQSLSPEDSELLADYRAATQEDQALVRRMLALAAEHGRPKA